MAVSSRAASSGGASACRGVGGLGSSSGCGGGGFGKERCNSPLPSWCTPSTAEPRELFTPSRGPTGTPSTAGYGASSSHGWEFHTPSAPSAAWVSPPVEDRAAHQQMPTPPAAQGSAPHADMPLVPCRRDTAEMLEHAPAEEDVNLVSCSICGRQFREERLPVHEEICRNISSAGKRRAEFESQRQRTRDALGNRWWLQERIQGSRPSSGSKDRANPVGQNCSPEKDKVVVISKTPLQGKPLKFLRKGGGTQRAQSLPSRREKAEPQRPAKGPDISDASGSAAGPGRNQRPAKAPASAARTIQGPGRIQRKEELQGRTTSDASGGAPGLGRAQRHPEARQRGAPEGRAVPQHRVTPEGREATPSRTGMQKSSSSPALRRPPGPAAAAISSSTAGAAAAAEACVRGGTVAAQPSRPSSAERIRPVRAAKTDPRSSPEMPQRPKSAERCRPNRALNLETPQRRAPELRREAESLDSSAAKHRSGGAPFLAGGKRATSGAATCHKNLTKDIAAWTSARVEETPKRLVGTPQQAGKLARSFPTQQGESASSDTPYDPSPMQVIDGSFHRESLDAATPERASSPQHTRQSLSASTPAIASSDKVCHIEAMMSHQSPSQASPSSAARYSQSRFREHSPGRWRAGSLERELPSEVQAASSDLHPSSPDDSPRQAVDQNLLSLCQDPEIGLLPPQHDIKMPWQCGHDFDCEEAPRRSVEEPLWMLDSRDEMRWMERQESRCCRTSWEDELILREQASQLLEQAHAGRGLHLPSTDVAGAPPEDAGRFFACDGKLYDPSKYGEESSQDYLLRSDDLRRPLSERQVPNLAVEEEALGLRSSHKGSANDNLSTMLDSLEMQSALLQGHLRECAQQIHDRRLAFQSQDFGRAGCS